MILAAALFFVDDADVALRAGAWIAELRGDVTGSKGGLAGSRLDLDSTLGLNWTAAPVGGIDVHLHDKLSGFAEYWDAGYRGTGTFATAQAYGGALFPAGSVVKTDLTMSMATLGAQYAFEIPLSRDSTLWLSPVGTLRYFDYRGSLSSAAARGSDGFNYVMPAFGVHLDIRTVDDVRFDILATWISIDSLRDRKVDFIDGHAAVSWQFWEGAYLETGYRFQRLDLRDRDGSSRRVDVNVEMDGPFVEMGFRF